MLRLLPKPGEGQDPPKRIRRPASALSLTPDEARNLRVSARNIARTFGGLSALARALGVVPGILTRKKHPGPGLAVALARLTKIPVESLLSGKLAAVPAQPSAAGGAA